MFEQTYTRNLELLPLARMFLNSEQPDPSTTISPEITLPSPVLQTLDLPKLSPSPPCPPPPPLLQTKATSESKLAKPSRNLLNSPICKLTPMTRAGSSDTGKPLRARSHSEQSSDNDTSMPHLHNELPFARRVRSATTLRPPEEDYSKISKIQPVNEKTMESHKRSISADNTEKKDAFAMCKERYSYFDEKTLDAVPAVKPLELDGLQSQQQFYDAIWSTLSDLNGWLDSMEIALEHVNENS